MNSDNLSKNTNRSIIHYNDKLKRRTEKLRKEGYMAEQEFYFNFIITILNCQILLNSESDALIV